MSTAATIPMKWAENLLHDNKQRCVCCGRVIRGNPVYVEVIDGGSQVAAPGLGVDETDGGYMGFFPVGPSCGKKHFAGFTHKSF